MSNSLFVPGRNCAAVARSGRLAFIVDAEEYFRAFMQACERAEREILILGWDFDSRTVLDFDVADEPIVLGEFLNGLAHRKRHLRIRVLEWDYPVVFGTSRELPPTLGIAWTPHRHIEFHFDDTHPVAGSHHQKIVAIDGRLAFSGGLDLTSKRWDTRSHKADDPRRTFAGEPYPPFHDVMIAVEGEAARELAAIARERWRLATGERLQPVAAGETDPWPAQLEAHARDGEVAISLTAPKDDRSDGATQVEALFLDMIAAAKHCIYIENQYFTSQSIGAALARSLAQREGPEIFVVTRLLSHGWLEEITMTTLRTELVRSLRNADEHGRFHAFYAHVEGLADGYCLDIHSKVMVVDEEWLRIGSANLSNRSMGMDTECDVTLEARGDAGLRAAIRRFRDGLVAEHSGAAVEEIARRIDTAGSIAAAIAGLPASARGLRRLEPAEPTDAQIAVAKVGDPAEPLLEPIVEIPEPKEGPRRRFGVRHATYAMGALFLFAIGLALVWTRTPLRQYITHDHALRLAEQFAGLWWAPLAVIFAYTPASLVMFPRWIITMTAVLAFGPWKGFVYGFAGILLAGAASFLPGRIVRRETVRRVAGRRLRPIVRFIQEHGFFAVMMVRLVPIAPFPVVNLVMGAMRLKLWQFLLGTFLGMLPGMLAATVLSEQLATALEDPSQVNPWIVALAILWLAAFAWLGQRMVRRRTR